jgi:hypothetical protein
MKRKNKKRILGIITSFFFLMFGLLPQKIFAQWDVNSLGGFGLPDSPRGITGIVGGIASWLLGLLFFISIIGFIIAGIMYLTAAGDDTRVEKAKKAMMYSIIGVIVGLSGYVIVVAVTAMLSGSSMF